MNRHDRRAEEAQLRELVAGMRWDQKPDGSYAIITMRIPAGGMMPAAQYTGQAAADRLRRFIEGFTQGAAAAAAQEKPE